MYSVVDSAALEVLEVHERAAGAPASVRIQVGNEKDLADGVGFMVEGDDVAPP